MSSGQIKPRFKLRFRSRSLVVTTFLLLQLAPLLALTLGAPPLLVLVLSVAIVLCTMPLLLGGMANLVFKGGMVVALGAREMIRPTLIGFIAALAGGVALLALWPT